MLAHCTDNFSVCFVSFSSETIAKQQEAMQLRFHQSYAIKGAQNFHCFHRTQIKMKGISPVITYSLVVQTSTNYQPKPVCLTL